MATLTPKLTLTGSAAEFGTALALSETDTLTVTKPFQGLSSIDVTTTGGDCIIVAASATVAYIYVKHTGLQGDGSTASTDNLDIEDGDNVAFARLAAGEWCFLPCNKAGVSKAIQLQATANTILAEYAYFTKG